MKITLLESSIGSGPRRQILASYLVNDSVVVDAGSIGFVTPIEKQRQVEHVFLSHPHSDHIASLPVFVENAYVPGPTAPSIYGSKSTIDWLKKYIFNDVIWPDMIRISQEKTPFLNLVEIMPEQAIEANGLQVTPISLDHVIPTFGFVIDDGESAVAIISDTSPTERVWEIINANDRIRGVFLECSFPNSMEWLADKSMHLTPNLFQKEVSKLNHDVPIITIHIKMAFDETVEAEVNTLGLPNVQIGEPGRMYEFS